VDVEVTRTAQDPFVEVTLGLVILVLIIIFHGTAVRTITRIYSQRWVTVTLRTPRWRVNMLLSAVVAGLAVVHLAETLIWSLPIYGFQMLPSMRDAYFYVLESYTTLGEGTVTLPDQWRLIGPMIAMSGLFTFGWTGSVLVSIMNEVSRLDRSQAVQDNKAEQQERQPDGDRKGV
jgi:hypothetical protein